MECRPFALVWSVSATTSACFVLAVVVLLFWTVMSSQTYTGISYDIDTINKHISIHTYIHVHASDKHKRVVRVVRVSGGETE